MFKMFWRNDKMNKQDLGWIIAIILLVILLVIGAWYFNNLISEQVYAKGFADGQLNVISSITTTGMIPYFTNDSLGNVTIQHKNINDICAGK